MRTKAMSPSACPRSLQLIGPGGLRPARKPRGFTLIELLIVVGIIAVLLAILLPAMLRAREQAKQLTCISKMRHLGSAMMAYLGSNENYFPKPAVGGTNSGIWYAEDWVKYEPQRLVNGQDSGVIWPYLTATWNHDPSLLICPSDNIDTHGTSEGIAYPYSYTLNEFLSRTSVMGHPQTIRLSRVINPAITIMIIDESSETIDDGCWAPQNYLGYGGAGTTYINVLSDRHMFEQEKHMNPDFGYGNVIFADGHGEWIERYKSTQPQYFVAYPGEHAVN